MESDCKILIYLFGTNMANQFYKYNVPYNGLHQDTVYSAGTNKPMSSRNEYMAMGGVGDFSDVDIRELPTNKLTTTSSQPQSNPYQLALEKAIKAYEPSDTYRQTLVDLDALDTGYKQADLNLRNNALNPVAMPILRGQQAIAKEQYDISRDTLEKKLARQQLERQMAIDSAKLGLEIYKPVEVGIGGSLLQRNPETNRFDTVGQGQSYSDKLSTSTVFDLIKKYPDAGISINDDPSTAQYKASQSQSFVNDQTATSTVVNPLTGEVTFYNKKAGYNTSAVPQSAPSVPTNFGRNPQVSYSSSDFVLGPDGRTVFYQGRGIDLPEFKQLTGQSNKPDNQVDFSMVQGIQNSSAGASKKNSAGGNLSGLRTLPTDPSKVATIQTSKAVGDAIGDVLKTGARQTSAYNTLLTNSQLLLDTMKKHGINASQYPDVNRISNALKAKGVDAGVVAAYKNSINTVRAEYMQFLIRNGNTTDAAKEEANRALPENLSPSQLQNVLNVIQKEGFNSIQSQQNTIGILQNYTQQLPFGNSQGQVPQVNFLQGNQGAPTPKVDLSKLNFKIK